MIKNVLKALVPVALMASLIAGCTAAELQEAKNVVTLGGVVCDAVLTATDPALLPLCATAQEVTDAVLALEGSGVPTSRRLPPSKDAIYAQVVAQRAAKASKLAARAQVLEMKKK